MLFVCGVVGRWCVCVCVLHASASNTCHAIPGHVISDSRDNVISGGRESGVGISSFLFEIPTAK